jgi:hypothetical protein
MPSPVTTYTDLNTMKAWLGIPADNTDNDAKVTAAIAAASRSVDNYCQRRFWLDTVLTARTFQPYDLLMLDLWCDGPGGDIGSLTGLTVACDTSGDGTYETVWSTTDFQPLPVNAPYAYAEPRPWTKLRAVGTKTFPWLVNTWLTHLNRVQVTALWGWPEIPEDVITATKLKAARIFHRKDSVQGIAGFGEFGAVKLSRGEDSDAMLLLTPYMYMSILVG